MFKARPGYSFAVLAAAVAAVFAFSAIDPAYAAERKSLRLATSQVGTYGYKVSAQLAGVLEKGLGGEYTITVNPYPSPTVAMKALMNGEAEISYTADVGMTQFVKNEGAFKGFTPTKPKIVHTWYAYPMESFMAVVASKGHLYKSLADFSGKPVFFTPAGFMNWLNFERIFKALGYQFKHVQIGVATQADAMQAGTIIGAVAYTTGGLSLPSYWRETELRIDLKVINPSPDEVKKLTAANLAPMEIDPKKVFSKDVGREDDPGRAAPVRLQRACGYARGGRLQDGDYVLQSAGRAREGRSGLRPPGTRLHGHAGKGHQCQSNGSGASGAGEIPEREEGLER